MTSDAVETAAQLIHQRHRAGTANVCGECREVARRVAEVLVPDPTSVGRCGASPDLRMARLASKPSCTLPAGHTGFHRDAESRAEWGRMWVDPPGNDEFADSLARALHDTDCGCGDYDADEDPRYITAARAALRIGASS